MTKRVRYITRKPSWFNRVNRIAEHNNCSINDVEVFLLDIMGGLSFSLLSYDEIITYDASTRDAFLDSWHSTLLENYSAGMEVSIDKIEAYDGFCVDVLWSGALEAILNDFMAILIACDDLSIERLKIHSRKLIFEFIK